MTPAITEMVSLRGFLLTFTTIDTGTPRPLKGLSFDRHVSPSADSDECFNLIKHWVTQCRDHHEECNGKSPSNWIPTRLVDVGNGSDGDMPKLVLRQDVPQSSQFLALSHCWGKTRLLQTKTDNILDHCVALKGLPPTFAHACRLTKALGFRYIWIDSLCIIQDNRLDWEREAAKMGEVYSEAALVIAASSANSSDEGFLNPRKDDYQGQVEVRDPSSHSIWSRKSYTVHYRRSIFHTSRTSLNPGTGLLGTRAWTFQEQALARRFVSFGPRELSWECRSFTDCECDLAWARRDPNQAGTEAEKEAYLKGNPDSEWMQLVKLSFDDMLEKGTRIDLYFEWRKNVLEPYTYRQITKSSDKLAALAAIATAFYSKLGPDEEYLAGLWRGDLVRGLGWFTNLERAVSDSYFPSWSWASLDTGPNVDSTVPGFPPHGGSVEFPMPWKHSTYESPCVVVDVGCVPASTIMPFGSVKTGAFVKLKGMFSSAVVEFYPRSSDGWAMMARKSMNARGSCHYGLRGMGGSDKVYNVKVDVFLEEAIIQDTGSSHTGRTTAIRSLKITREENLPTVHTEYPVWCFLLGTYKAGPTRGSIVLVLGRSLVDPDAFERLGMVEMDIGYNTEAAAFEGWEERTVKIV